MLGVPSDRRWERQLGTPLDKAVYVDDGEVADEAAGPAAGGAGGGGGGGACQCHFRRGLFMVFLTVKTLLRFNV